ncbi:hypothetical protein Zmor_010115 [Zophobas morio]|uniref:CHK kinase-like domain-containing protein n=2 Tax=Zophobas morio TaxID=2755281 RepID=A0AA38IMR0_9CUCU|nr:hypothetical protein Zmor_010115 [Zophobas morio]
MNVERIEKLENILFLDENKTIIDHQVKRLTAPGENFGSLMLSVDITVQNAYGTEEIHTVAKMVPPNGFIQEVFNTQTTFKNEIGFYNNIVPVLHEFQREQGMDELVDFFPKYYGGRINLNGDPSVVDSDAVLLLENLKIAGYENFERTLGFDLETSKLIVTDLAHLHAVPLGLKLKKPDVFETEVKKYLAPFRPQGHSTFYQRFFSVIDKIDELKHLKKRIHKAFDNVSLDSAVREPFATFVHQDCWVNNIMIKVEKGRSVKNKLVDFQVCDYGSPAKDLIFFLFANVQNHVLETHYDDLVRYYHETFTSILQKLKYETTRFAFDALLEEINYEAGHSQFLHLMFMTFPMFAPKGTVRELTELTLDDFISESTDITDLHKEKLIFIIQQFDKHNWI